MDALRGLDLEVPRHSIFGFLGPNSAGKTTTIKLLLGLARPTGGAGTLFGLDIARDSLAIRRRVGYLVSWPLSPSGVNFWQSRHKSARIGPRTD